MRPRQVRYQAALRPDNYCPSDSRPLPHVAVVSDMPNESKKSSDPMLNRFQSLLMPGPAIRIYPRNASRANSVRGTSAIPFTRHVAPVINNPGPSGIAGNS